MANDIDLWNDIEQLEEMGKKEEANDLLTIFNYRYNEYDMNKLDKAIKKFELKYHYNPL